MQPLNPGRKTLNTPAINPTITCYALTLGVPFHTVKKRVKIQDCEMIDSA